MILSDDEIKYISKIPEDKIVIIKPFSDKQTPIADEIISKINNIFPTLQVLHMGASGLKISGQGDLDIYILTHPGKFSQYLPVLEKIFDKPKSQKYDSIAWEFEVESYPIELYLTDPNSKPMKKQIGVFNILKKDPKLLQEYEHLKSQMSGKSFRKYQRKKYEFYHRILD